MAQPSDTQDEREKVAPLGAVDYTSTTPPAGYKCGKCGVHGVKLWREYNTFLDHQTLRCAPCACTEATKDGKTYKVEARPFGKVCTITTYDPVLEPKLYQVYGASDEGGDQIGWRIPAVPTDDGETYWGYSSVSAQGCAWWYALPLELPSAA